MTIRQALVQGSASLRAADIDTSSLDASLLLGSILNISRTALITEGTSPLHEKDFNAFQQLLDRRLNGECTAYILGKKEFRNLEFLVNPSVLVPRPDTETLVEAAIKDLSEKINNMAVNNHELSLQVLDLCTGSGAVAIALKNESPQLEVHAVDISIEALETAKANAIRLLGENKITFYHGDLYSTLPAAHYSLIISNPPYIPTEEIYTLSAEVQREPHLALDGGQTGLEIIQQIIEKAPDYLISGGSLLLEASPNQMDKISSLLEKRGFSDIKLFNDLSEQHRVIGGIFDK